MRVNRDDALTQCVDDVSRRRRRQADNQVYLNKTLLTDAINQSITDLQQVRGSIYSTSPALALIRPKVQPFQVPLPLPPSFRLSPHFLSIISRHGPLKFS